MSNNQPVPEVSPKVPIVLPVLNEGPRLRQTLACIRDTTTVSYEVIVVNDATADSCCDPLRTNPPAFDNTLLQTLRATRHIGLAPGAICLIM
jgi:hypothetical protein